METRETTRRTRRCTAAVRIALTLAALTPAAGVAADHMPERLMPAPAAHVATAAAEGELPREAAEWEHHRRRHMTS